MTEFPLKIVTPDGVCFDGPAEELVVRSISGDVAIMARHTNFVTALGMGPALIVASGQRRTAACIGGMLSMVDGKATLLPTTFEWSDQIDVDRAEASQRRADTVLKDKNASDTELRMAQARLRRALVRKSVASGK